jgi:hypothetical protein
MATSWRALGEKASLKKSLFRDFLVPMDHGCPIPPDFLFNPVGLTTFMRLSLMKAAHAVTFRAAHRKPGISLVFCEMWDITNLNRKPPRTDRKR